MWQCHNEKPMTTYRALLLFALACLMSICPRVHAGPGFNDGDFTTYTWTAVKIQDSTATQNATFSAGELFSGGFTGNEAYLSNSFSFSYNGTETNQGIVIGNLCESFTYTPSISGAINSISSFDIASIYSISTGAPGLSLSIGLVLCRTATSTRTNFWASSRLVQPEGAVVLCGNGLCASRFQGPVNRDFSTNGNTIEFGFVASASLSSGTSPATISGSIGADDLC